MVEEEEPTGIKIDKNLLLPRSKNKSESALDIEVNEGVTDVNAKWKEHWVDMPEYVQED